jgi:hypothetical protein
MPDAGPNKATAIPTRPRHDTNGIVCGTYRLDCATMCGTYRLDSDSDSVFRRTQMQTGAFHTRRGANWALIYFVRRI